MIKKKQIVKLFIGSLSALLLVGCGDPIEDVVYKNIEGLNSKDVDMVMETIDDRNEEVYEETKKQVEQLINDYDLTFEIEKIEVTRRPKDENRDAEEKPKDEDTSAEDIFADTDFEGVVTEEDLEKKKEADKKKAEMEKNRPWIAKVKVMQVTRKAQDMNPFVDNRVMVVHTLHKYPDNVDAGWKIYSSSLRKVRVFKEDEES